jgi:hypothetical protein
MRGRIRRGGLHLGWLAGLAFAAALLAAGAGTPGYRHALHPVGLLGSAPLPVAPWFNLLGLLLPGLALAGFALAAERVLAPLGHGRSSRIATGLLLIAGLAFALQGLLPLDARDLDGAASQRHAAVHALALLAWLASTALLALALRASTATAWLAWCGAGLALLLGSLLAWPPSHWWPAWAAAPGFSQRAVLAVFFLWPALLALGLRRAAPR